jgi:hypothetical protein
LNTTDHHTGGIIDLLLLEADKFYQILYLMGGVKIMTTHLLKNTTIVPLRPSKPRGLSEDVLKISGNTLTILSISVPKNA